MRLGEEEGEAGGGGRRGLAVCSACESEGGRCGAGLEAEAEAEAEAGAEAEGCSGSWSKAPVCVCVCVARVQAPRHSKGTCVRV